MEKNYNIAAFGYRYWYKCQACYRYQSSFLGIGIGCSMDLQQGIGIGIRASVEH